MPASGEVGRLKRAASTGLVEDGTGRVQVPLQVYKYKCKYKVKYKPKSKCKSKGMYKVRYKYNYVYK